MMTLWRQRAVLLMGVLISALIISLTGGSLSAPARAQDPDATLIESDSPAVAATGDWESVEDAAASGGRYLRTADPDAMLTLAFEGGRRRYPLRDRSR